MNLNRNTKLEISKNNDICAICLQSMKLNEIVRKSTCGHTYHVICIDKWLEEKSSCPLCKKDLLGSVD